MMLLALRQCHGHCWCCISVNSIVGVEAVLVHFWF